MSDDNEFVDNGDRSKAKVGSDKGTENPEIEIVDRQKAPMVSAKIERQRNLEDYNSVTAQVFMSSGTLKEYRGEILNEDGEVKEEVLNELEAVAEGLAEKCKKRVNEALREAERGELE